ncbi:MAG: ABC transporter ATP-binding protein [Eubacteriales bacterium]|nr:ABC transporter ATP-binding protein [Eubacteriales bacterium]
MPEKAFLSVRGLSHVYHTKNGETPALHDISFDLFPGEFTAIVGPSGCGKSTLLDLLAGLLPVQSGYFFYPSGIRPPNIGYMLQKDHLLEYRTIYKNIILGLEIQHRLTKENDAYVRGLMEQYGIADFAHSWPRELSGGMRQRAALIRTLAGHPAFLLLDEPFSALDYQTRLDVSGDISHIIREQKLTALLVTHDLSEAISIADRVIVLGKRPGSIRSIVPVDFEMPVRPTPQEARLHPKFQQYFNQIWKELKHDDLSA